MSKPRVRFAPSPTGMLHIGGARTAVFNYLFAQKYNGDFILRIEDTDRERSTKESIQAILDGMEILNLTYNEKYFQSENINRHKEVAYKLLKERKAYEDFDVEKGTAIKIKIPEGITTLNDLIKGKIEFNNKEIEDFVLLRSDGTPTYNLAVVVDDIDMKITHVLRGDDHISNTPKQILLYQAIGADMPKFGHLPMIHDMEGKKLSKRKSAVAIKDYIDAGYMPEAICNYLLHLGSYGCYNKDIITIQEAIENFDISKLGQSPSKFDFDKLNYINLHYLKNLSDDKFVLEIKKRLEQDLNRKISSTEEERLKKATFELKKIATFKEGTENSKWILEDFDYISYYKEEVPSNLNLIYTQVKNFIDKSENIEELKIKTKEISKEFNPHDFYHSIRYILIGKNKSFAVTLIFDVLGLQEVKKRFELFSK